MPHWNAAWTRQEKRADANTGGAGVVEAGFRWRGRNLRFSGDRIDALAGRQRDFGFRRV
jgi:hypothetical protein